MRAEPLDSEVVVDCVRVPNMPDVHRVVYRGVAIWQRLSPPSAEDVKDALQTHRMNATAASTPYVPPNFNNTKPKRGRGRPAKQRSDEVDE